MASTESLPPKLPAFCSAVSLTASGRPVLLPDEIECVLFDDVGIEFPPSGPESATTDAPPALALRGGTLSLTSHRVIWVAPAPSAPPSVTGTSDTRDNYSDRIPPADAPASTSGGASASASFCIPLSRVTSAAQQRKSVKHMFASPRVALTVQVPTPQRPLPNAKNPNAAHSQGPRDLTPGPSQSASLYPSLESRDRETPGVAHSGPPQNPLYSLHQQHQPPPSSHQQQQRQQQEEAPQPRPRLAEATIVFRGQSGPDLFLRRFPEVAGAKKWESSLAGAPAGGGGYSSAAGRSSSGPAAAVGRDKGPEHAPFNPAMAGIGGILKREQEKMQQTEQGLKEAFTDLNALMAKASEMVQLADRMRTFVARTQAAKPPSEGPLAPPTSLGPSPADERPPGAAPPAAEGPTGGPQPSAASAAATAAGFSSAEEMQDWLLSVGISSPVTKESAGALFHQQLSRQLADFLEAPLQRSGGMLSLVDVYCLFNRARGTELISPDDLLKACTLWGALFHPPMRLRRFSSGVLVVHLMSCSQEHSLRTVEDLLMSPGARSTGVGAVEVAGALGVGTALAIEELLSAEQQGHLCRDDGPDGLRFFRNFFLDPNLIVSS